MTNNYGSGMVLTIPLTVSAGNQNTCDLTIPDDGTLLNVRLSFPQSKNAVQARVYLNGNQIIPAKGVAIIDNSSVEFPVGKHVQQGDVLLMWVGNGDITSSHTVVLTATVQLDSIPQNQYGISKAIITPEGPKPINGSDQTTNEDSGTVGEETPLTTDSSSDGSQQQTGAPMSFVSSPTPSNQLPPPIGSPPSLTPVSQNQQPTQSEIPRFVPRGTFRPPTTVSDFSSVDQSGQQGMSQYTFTLLLVLLVGLLILLAVYIALNHSKPRNI